MLKKNFLMLQINRNNLSKDQSPYLQQHKDNPVFWQVWSQEALDISKEKKNQFFLALDMQAVTGVM